MANMKQIYKETDELIKTIGLEKTKEVVKQNIDYNKNSVTKAFWSQILESYLPTFEK